MKVFAKLHYLRIAPRKVRLVADLIRGKPVKEAQTVLNFVRKRATKPLLKLLKSAIANARNNFQVTKENLYIFEIKVDEGPKLKRWRPRARGQAFEIQKKTSHITLVLDDHPPSTLPRKRVSETKKKEIKKKSKRRRVEKKEVEKTKRIKKMHKEERPKLRPELEIPKPKTEKGIRKFFRRKAF